MRKYRSVNLKIFDRARELRMLVKNLLQMLFKQSACPAQLSTCQPLQPLQPLNSSVRSLIIHSKYLRVSFALPHHGGLRALRNIKSLVVQRGECAQLPPGWLSPSCPRRCVERRPIRNTSQIGLWWFLDGLGGQRSSVCRCIAHNWISIVLTAGSLEQWVSVKITTAERTMRSRELHCLRALVEHAKGDLGAENIVQLLDDFLHEGPNGCHQCLVFELLGPTVNMIVEDYNEGERLDSDALLKISTQLLQSVAFMHKAGYAHGGILDSGLCFF